MSELSSEQPQVAGHGKRVLARLPDQTDHLDRLGTEPLDGDDASVTQRDLARPALGRVGQVETYDLGPSQLGGGHVAGPLDARRLRARRP